MDSEPPMDASPTEQAAAAATEAELDGEFNSRNLRKVFRGAQLRLLCRRHCCRATDRWKAMQR